MPVPESADYLWSEEVDPVTGLTDRELVAELLAYEESGIVYGKQAPLDELQQELSEQARKVA